MKNLSEIKAYVFDMDGTLYTGETLIDGAAEAAERATALGKRVCYFTNNSSRSEEEYVERLRAFGLPASPGDVVTSGEVAADYVSRKYPGRRVYVFGTRALRETFSRIAELDDENPELAVMGFHTGMVYADLVRLCNFVRRGMPYLATHPDKNCPAEPFPIPDAGSFLSLVETSTGRRPDLVCGKPTRLAGDYLMRTLSARPQEIAFVGDRYSTDILLGKNNGFLTVHVLSGASEDTAGLEPADLILPSVKELIDYI